MSVTWSTAFLTISNSSGNEGSPTSPVVQALTFAILPPLRRRTGPPDVRTLERGVGVIAEVDGQQRPLAEGRAAIEGPEGGFERLDDVAGPADLGRLAASERAVGDLGDPGRQRLLVPEAGDRLEPSGEQFVLRGP